MGSRTSPGVAADSSAEPLKTRARERTLWHGRAGPFAVLTIALVWLRRSGSLLVPLALGVLVTATLLCTVPFYLLLTADAQLQYLLATTPKTEVNIEAQVALSSVAAADTANAAASLQQLGSQYLSGFAPDSMSFLDASDVAFTSVNGVPIDSRSNLIHASLATAQGHPVVFDYAQASPYMRLYAGRLPDGVSADQMPEVLATPKLNVHVGDVIGLKQIGSPNTDVRVRVVGIWFPKDQNDPFWNGHSYDTVNNCGLICPPDIYPLLFTRTGLFEAIAPFRVYGNLQSPPYLVNAHEVYFTQPSRLHVADIQAALDHIGTFLRKLDEENQSAQNIYITTRLDTLLTTMNRAQTQGALPLNIVVAQITTLILLFIFTVAALLIEERESTIVALKSRGASRTQLVVSFGLLALFPAALMATAGAILASWVSVALLRVQEPITVAVVGAGYYTSAVSPGAAIGPALVAGALSIIDVMGAAWLTTRNDALTYRRERGRSSRVPVWKRFYLDIFLAVLCLAGYVELATFGGFGIRSQLGTSTGATDPFQLVAPVLLALAGTLIMLRVFGPIAHLCAKVAMRGRGATRMLAFVRVSRSSGQVTRLTLLITLVVSFSFFALTYQSVLVHNAADRAAYAAGGDELVTIDESIQDTEYIQTAPSPIGGLPGAQAATPVVRAIAKLTSDLGSGTVGMLGIDPDSFAQVAYWRGDYAGQSLPSLLAQMRGHEQGAPAGDGGHPMWALVSRGFAANLNVKIGDRITLMLYAGREGEMNIAVGAIVDDFPTMFDATGNGYVVVDERDLLNAFANGDIGNLPLHGANEYWLRTDGRPGDDIRRTHALQQLEADQVVSSVTDRRTLAQQFQSDPVTSGMGGLLLLGAVFAVLMAGLACILQAQASASERQIQFAVMRTLGMTSQQIRTMVMDEQVLQFAFGVIGGTALGLVLSAATLPVLTYASAVQDPSTVGVPPYLLSFNVVSLGILYVALILMFAIALLLEMWLASRSGFGQALRIGED